MPRATRDDGGVPLHATTILDGLHFGVCPRWHDGRLWFSDFYDRAVFAADTSGNVERIIAVSEQPSGLGWLPDGRLLVVSMRDRRVLRRDPEELVPHADLRGIATFHANDMVVTATGRAWVGNFGLDFEAYVAQLGYAAMREPAHATTKLARVEPDGTTWVAATGLHFPSGMVITPDGGTLIVAETFGWRLTAFTVRPDGLLTHRRVWAALPSIWPVGIALDAAGAVWVANAGATECVRVGEGGAILGRVATSQRCFACALGGEDRQTLYLMTAPGTGEVAEEQRGGKVEMVHVAVPGAGWP